MSVTSKLLSRTRAELKKTQDDLRYARAEFQIANQQLAEARAEALMLREALTLADGSHAHASDCDIRGAKVWLDPVGRQCCNECGCDLAAKETVDAALASPSRAAEWLEEQRERAIVEWTGGLAREEFIASIRAGGVAALAAHDDRVRREQETVDREAFCLFLGGSGVDAKTALAEHDAKVRAVERGLKLLEDEKNTTHALDHVTVEDAAKTTVGIFPALARRDDRVRRETLEEAAKAADVAKLPIGYQWGRDAMESFEFGRERAAEAIRSLAPRAPETAPAK